MMLASRTTAKCGIVISAKDADEDQTPDSAPKNGGAEN
jgi:hypothetical protein